MDIFRFELIFTFHFSCFFQESLQHSTSKGRFPSNQRQLFLGQEISDQQERHVFHSVMFERFNEDESYCLEQGADKRDQSCFADKNRDLSDVAQAQPCGERFFQKKNAESYSINVHFFLSRVYFFKQHISCPRLDILWR